MPLIAGTLTTVFAFVPMLLMSGIMGQYMKYIPITVTIVLLSSLFVGLGVVPALGSRRLKISSITDSIQPKKGILGLLNKLKCIACTDLFGFLTKKYRKALIRLINNKDKRRKLVITIIILFILSLSLPVTGILKMDMFPSEDNDLFFIEVKKPVNTLLEGTSETIKGIESILLQEPQIKSFAVTVGHALFFGGSGENVAEIVVNLKDDRTERSPDIVEKYQKIFDKLIDAEVSIIQMSSGPPGAAPVDIGTKGDNLKELELFTLELKEILKEIPGVINVQTSIEESKGEFTINLDRTKAQLYGISTLELAQVLRNAVKGTTATTIRYQGDEIDVVVKYALNSNSHNGESTNTATINTLESLTIATPQGDIPLSAFTQTELKASRPSIRHEDGHRSFRLTGYNESDITPGEIVSAFQKEISKLNIPQDMEIVYGGEQEDLQQSYNDLFRAMILAVFLIAGILILQFRSYRQPLFILSTIPLSFIGVFPGLILIGSPLTLPAIIGIVALAGIVVNNGIILVDMINKNRREDMIIAKAIVNACTVRLRPIVLTTITTIVGILPITLSSEIWGGLGFSIIFGLTVSAGFTLFTVPLLYNAFAEKELDVIE